MSMSAIDIYRGEDYLCRITNNGSYFTLRDMDGVSLQTIDYRSFVGRVLLLLNEAKMWSIRNVSGAHLFISTRTPDKEMLERLIGNYLAKSPFAKEFHSDKQTRTLQEAYESMLPEGYREFFPLTIKGWKDNRTVDLGIYDDGFYAYGGSFTHLYDALVWLHNEGWGSSVSINKPNSLHSIALDRGLTADHFAYQVMKFLKSIGLDAIKFHPSGVACITITEHMSFCVGNAVEYLLRAGLKNPSALEDLKKARWYIDREIQRLSD